MRYSVNKVFFCVLDSSIFYARIQSKFILITKKDYEAELLIRWKVPLETPSHCVSVNLFVKVCNYIR